MPSVGKSKPRKVTIKTYKGAAGGWGSMEGMALVARSEGAMPVGELLRQNKTDGFMCTSCAWPKPAKPHPAEFCEKRRPAHDLGPDAQAVHVGLLRAAHGHRAA